MPEKSNNHNMSMSNKEKLILDFLLKKKESQDKLTNKNVGILRISGGPIEICTKEVLPYLKIKDVELGIILNDLYTKFYLISKIETRDDKMFGKFYLISLPNNFIYLCNKYKTEGKNEIENIEILKDETENKKITVYINIQYDDVKYFRRGKFWEKMYKLAEDQVIDYNKPFYDYFNSNGANPLYKKEGFEVTKIFKKEDNSIIPNIEIKIITQKAVSQRIKLA